MIDKFANEDRYPKKKKIRKQRMKIEQQKIKETKKP